MGSITRAEVWRCLGVSHSICVCVYNIWWVYIHVFINLSEVGVGNILMDSETAESSGHLVVSAIMDVSQGGKIEKRKGSSIESFFRH